MVIACAGAESMVGEGDAAEQRLVRALDELADDRSGPAAAVRIQLARDALHRTDVESGSRWARAATEIATEVGDRPLAAQAAALFALLGCMADPRTADAAVANAADRLDALSVDELDLCLDAPFNLGHAEL